MAPRQKLPRHSAKSLPPPSLKVPSAREAAYAFLDTYLADAPSTLAELLRNLQEQADFSRRAPWAGVLRATVLLTAPPGASPALSDQSDQAREHRANLLSALSVWVTETLAESKQAVNGPGQVHIEAYSGQALSAAVVLPLYSATSKPRPTVDPDRASWVTGLQTQKTEWSKAIFTVASAGIGVSLNAVVAKKETVTPATATRPVPAQAASSVVAAPPSHSISFETSANFTALAAAIAFAVCVYACFRAFEVSSEYLTWMIKNPAGTTFEDSPQEKPLKAIKRLQLYSLLTGVTLLVIAALQRALV